MRKVDLWQYLPPFLREFLELGEVVKAEEPEFQHLVGRCDEVMKDYFITTATKRGIARFEQLMHIVPTNVNDLENRRSAVITRWWNMIPYTLRSLRNRIVIVQGNDNVQITFDPDNPHRIIIATRLISMEQRKDLAYIVQTMLPANLEVTLVSHINFKLEMSLGVGAGAALTSMVIFY